MVHLICGWQIWRWNSSRRDELDGYWTGRATGVGTHRPVRPVLDAAERGVLTAISLVLSGLG